MGFSSFKSFGYQVAIPKIIVVANDSVLNGSFESPITNFKYYRNFSIEEKANFKWNAGGNGPAITTPNDGFLFPSYQSNQALAMQSASFIEQTLYLNAGKYELSLVYVSRNGTELNPINILVDSTIISTIDVAASQWTVYKVIFNVINSGKKIIRLEGTIVQEDKTMGIDLIEVVTLA